MSAPKALLIALSGPSSSGKTTLARLLRDIIPNSFILHEDDFYKTDAEIPVNPEHNLEDWDCLESLNLPALESALRHVKDHGAISSDLESKEDKNSVGNVAFDAALIERLKVESTSKGQSSLPVAIIDGFLLYSEELKAVRDLFDVKLFLHTDYHTAKTRREARSGYVTIEGFWADPPGYVDKIVWPNYVKDHAFLFQHGDVNGELDEAALTKLGIEGMPMSARGDMTACLKWAYEIVQRALQA
ncbi:ribosylnicotinamide kinase [Oleoguttula sp. CCFEE 5521]